MTTMEIGTRVALGLMIVALLLGSLCITGLKRLLAANKVEHEATKDALASALAASAPPTTPTVPWVAMPGKRIELGATGYYVQLDLRPNTPLYFMCSPEHTLLAYGNDLASIKGLAELRARERAEFEPSEPLQLSRIGRPA